MISMMKRRFGRAPIQVPATCTLTEQRIEGTLWQIGEGGFFVELPVIEGLPDALAVGFELPGHGAHRVVAKPVWRTQSAPRTAPGASRGAGCEFRDVGPTTRKAIAAYVKKMKQTYSQLQFALALDRPTPQLAALLRETRLEELRDRKVLKEHVAMIVAQMQTAA